MGREEGQLIHFRWLDPDCMVMVERVGEVKAISFGGHAIIESNKEWFQETSSGITQLDDNNRCVHCGQFLCQCSTHPPIIQMNPVPFKDLAGYAQKQLIPCVEGRLKYLNEPKAYKSGPNVGKPYQFGTLSEIGTNLEIGVKFEGDLVQPVANKGKIIRLEAHQGSKGLSGVYMDIGEYEGKETRTARCTATAVVQYIAQGDAAANAPQTAPAASAPTSAPPQHTPRQDAPQAGSARNTGHQGGQLPQPVFDDALADYKRAFCKVCESFGHDPDKIMQELTAEKLAEITTSVSMASTRGQYGAYIGYLFEEDKDAPPWNVPQQKAKAGPLNGSWKTFVHQKSGKKLGEIEEGKLYGLIRWALVAQPSAEAVEARALQANLLMAAADLKIDKRNCFFLCLANAEGYPSEFDENDFEEVVGAAYSKASKNLSDADWTEILRGWDDTIARCKRHRQSVKPDNDTSDDEAP